MHRAGRGYPTDVALVRRLLCAVAAAATIASVTLAVGPVRAASPVVHAAYAQQCPDPYPARRDRSNPLMLSHRPGANPLNGARFFVDGPRHGPAAGAIATLLGVDPKSYPDSYSWARFKNDLENGALANRLNADPAVRRKVRLLEKIADQPEEQRFSVYSMGGGPGAIFRDVQKIFCHNMTADPGSIPIITTYFLHPVLGSCATRAQILSAGPAFRRRVNEMAAATANRPAVYLLELDGLGSSICMRRSGGLRYWEADLRYEATKMASLPHTVVYLEAGYSDSNSAVYTARALNASGIRRIRGFFTNDTHNQWTINEIRWGNRISRLTNGAHFIVNTATNGRGPKLNPHPVTQGIEDLCNAPGRGMGPPPTTSTGFPMVDAFLWTGVPGNSSGHCRGGTDSGTFWLARALELSANALDKLGPRIAGDPY
jgi:endoglucanase